MTELELVREYFPRARRASMASHILWEMTAYPICGLEHTREQLAALAGKCAPVHKRGWVRKLKAESLRIYAEMDALCKSKTD